MSKSKKKRKKPVNNVKRKKSYKKQIIGSVAGVLIVAAIVVVAVIFGRNPNSELIDKTWTSYEAYNSDKEQVELSEVYNNYYTTYQGRLMFNNDGTFEIWLNVGDADDGTHKGTYTYNGETINVQYGSGEEAEFKISRDDNGAISYIDVPYSNGYDTYNVYFN